MRQPHKNLFFFYRGAVPTDQQAELLLDRQLEDNATKALIYVLEHANRSRVLEPFLKDVVGLTCRLRVDETQFALQRVDIARPSVQQRVALIISPTSELSPGDPAAHEAGRPDAWIWEEDSFAILVETKIRGSANRAQLGRHIQGAEGWTLSNSRRQVRSWSEIYAFFLRVRGGLAGGDATTLLLLKEFLGYIRMIGLASDTTFDLDDFGYFLLKPDDRDSTVKALLSRKLTQFTEHLIRTRAMRGVLQKFGKSDRMEDFVSPGVFRRDGTNYWVTIGPKERRDRCHFTVRLGEDGISLEAFSPHKSFTRPFVRKIAEQPDAFIASLRLMGPKDSYMLRLREAYYQDPESSYKGQRIADKVDYLVVHPRVLTPKNVASLIIEPIEKRLTEGQLRPEIFLVRHFGLSELVGKSQAVDLVASGVGPMLPYLEFALDL